MSSSNAVSRALTSLAMVIAALAFAPSASADTWCVGNAPPPFSCDSSHTKTTVQEALTAAAGNAGQDTVAIGPGTYSGEFTYNGTGGSNNVTINGAGPGMTSLTADGLSIGETALTITGDPGSAVANLTIGIPAADSEIGLYLGPLESAFGVNVSDQSGTTAATGVELQGGTFDGNSPNLKAAIQMHSGTSGGGGASTAILADGAAEVHDVTISGGVVNGIDATQIADNANVTVQRASITAGQPVTVNGSGADASAVVEDSIIHSTASAGNSAAVTVINPGGTHNATFQARQDTIEGGGADAYGVHVFQTSSDANGPSVSATIANSIVGESASGPGHPLGLTGSGPPTAANAMRTSGTLIDSDANTSADTSTANNSNLSDSSFDINQDPLFTNAAAADYHLQSGSPAIDAASNTQTGSSMTDYDGNARVAQGTSGSSCPNTGDGEPCPDMGAYEVAASGSAPVLANIESPPLSYPAGGDPVAVTQSLTVADSGSSTIAGATVKIASGYSNGDDFLGFAPQNGISGSFSNLDGTLTLTGTASVLDYRTALRSITYSNGNTTNPSAATRTVTFQVNDGSGPSNTVSRDIAFDAAAPAVNTTSFTVKDQSNVVMNGDVNPEGLDTHWHFQYGPDLDHMPNDLPSTAGTDLGARDHVAHQVSYPLAVDAGKQTCFRLVAVNSQGTTYGNDNGNPPGKGLCVTTSSYIAPDVHTALPNATGEHSIDMEGTVNPEGIATTYYFQISTASDVAGATNVPLAARSLGDQGGSSVAVPTETASGLTPDTTYYYRLVASNAGGTSFGNIIQANTAKPSRTVLSNPGNFTVHVQYLGGDPSTAGLDVTGAKFDAGLDGEVWWTCSVNNDTSPVSKCLISITSPDGKDVSVLADPDAAHTPAFHFGIGRLPTSCAGPSPCIYHVKVDVADASGNTFAATRSYTVNPPPTPAQEQKAEQGTFLDTLQQLQGLDLEAGVLYREIKDPAGNVVATVSSNGKIYPGALKFDSLGNIIAAGGGNIIAAGGGNIISEAGAGIVSAGSHNLVVFDKDGKPVGIIAAGGGNVLSGKYEIIAAGGGNIVSAGGGNIVSAGGGNIISEAGAGIVSAGGGNIDLVVKGTYIVSAGGGNIIAAGGGNIVSAGGGNISALDFGDNVNLLAGLTETIVSSFGTNPAKLGALINSPSFMVSLTPNLGTIKSNVDTLANPSQLAHQRIVAARAHRGVRIATAHLAVTHRGKTLLTFSYTKAGHKLVTKLAKQNRARIRHHKRPLTLKLRLTDVFTPKHGKARTLTRVFTIKPGVPKPTRHK